MKLKVLFICLAAIALFSCEEDLDSVGVSMQPDKDKINVFADTISFQASTVKLDSMYSKTIYGLLGNIQDPSFGSLKAGYMCQFYAPEDGDLFVDTVIGHKIDSVSLSIYFSSWIGDSLAPMEVTVHPIVKKLEKNFYTNLDPTKYCDLQTILGKKVYTARNLNIPDENYSPDNLKEIRIKLPAKIGQDLYDEYRKPRPNAFSNLEDFNDFLKGFYLKSSFGSGNLINVYESHILLHYQRTVVGIDVDKNDSIYVAPTNQRFKVTPEVIQLNMYTNADDKDLLDSVKNPDRFFAKSPAGIVSKITIPIPEIIAKIGKKKLSNAKLSFSAFEKEIWDYAMPTSSQMLLVSPDSIVDFFEKKLPPNYVTSYPALNLGNTYNFGNISSLIKKAIEVAPDKNLELLMIPVSFQSQQTSNGGSYYYSTQNFLYPSAVAFKKSAELLRMPIVYTDSDK